MQEAQMDEAKNNPSQFSSCITKQEKLKLVFSSCATPEAKYQKIIEFGKNLSPIPSEAKIPENIVPGCQSIVYLQSRLINGKIFFYASSEALISAGLVALLIYVYNEEAPETILKCPPQFIEDLGLSSSLSPTRSNGLGNIYLRMKQDALRHLLSRK